MNESLQFLSTQASLTHNLTAVSVCPTYCSYCTREYSIGGDTETVTKKSFKPGLRRWNEIFTYIEANPQLQDIVVSGGDSFYIQPDQIRGIGDRLIKSK